MIKQLALSVTIALFGLTNCARAGDQQSASANQPNPTMATIGKATGDLRARAADGLINVYGYKVIKTYPHDETAFTQGLFFQDGQLYESTGQNGQSFLRAVDLETGKISRQKPIDAAYFGEGSTAIGNRLYSLSWTSGTAFVHDLNDFTPITTFRYEGEGWGLTNDGTHLVMSDGTSELRFINPDGFAEIRRLLVTLKDQPIRNINELEWIKDQVYANLWLSNWVAMIDPQSGDVTGLIDFTGLLSEAETARMEAITGKNNVLNGIAYLADSDRLFVTGKNWPSLFEVELVFREVQ